MLAVLVASAMLVGDQWTSEAADAALMGGGMVVAIQLVWWLIRLIGSRRSAGAGKA